MGILADEHGVAQSLVGHTPGVMLLTLTLANTEYTLSLPKNVARFTLQARTAADVKLATVSGQSGTTYITVKSGSALSEDLVDTDAGLSLYLQSANAGTVVEVLYWQSK